MSVNNQPSTVSNEQFQQFYSILGSLGQNFSVLDLPFPEIRMDKAKKLRKSYTVTSAGLEIMGIWSSKMTIILARKT